MCFLGSSNTNTRKGALIFWGISHILCCFFVAGDQHLQAHLGTGGPNGDTTGSSQWSSVPARLQPEHTNPRGTVQWARLAWCHQQPEKPLVRGDREKFNKYVPSCPGKQGSYERNCLLFSTVISSEKGKYNMHQPELSVIGQNRLFSSFPLFFPFSFPHQDIQKYLIWRYFS